jgi:hypothetical protein
LFFNKYAVLRRKSKDWLPQNQDNGSKWSDMSTHGLLFQWASTTKIQLSIGLAQSEHHHHLIESNLFSPFYRWRSAYFVLNRNHSLTLPWYLKILKKRVNPMVDNVTNSNKTNTPMVNFNPFNTQSTDRKTGLRQIE